MNIGEDVREATACWWRRYNADYALRQVSWLVTALVIAGSAHRTLVAQANMPGSNW